MRARSHRLGTAAAAAAGVLLAGCYDASSEIMVERVSAQATGPCHQSTTAEKFAEGVISDDNEQWRITFTPDGDTAYFAEGPGFFPVTRQAMIYVSRFIGGEWTSPEIASFSGQYSDMDPAISPDGQRLYFSSIRPVGGEIRGDLDIWMIERAHGGWSEPVRLAPEVNSTADELYPSVSADGTLYFASGPPFPQAGTDFDIYRAAPSGDRFAPREALGPGVNTSPTGTRDLQDSWEFNPEISADGRTLIFTSLRPGGFGLGDLYVSRYADGEWTPARNLGPLVNTAADEYHPTLARNQQDLYFVRRLSARGDFYRIPACVLDIF